MNLENAANKVRVPGHFGPHPEAYHSAVYRRLRNATRGLSGDAYAKALQAELTSLQQDVRTSGHELNNLITR